MQDGVMMCLPAPPELLGIHVVSTSSIGGVQQGGQESMDISADLHGMPSCESERRKLAYQSELSRCGDHISFKFVARAGCVLGNEPSVRHTKISRVSGHTRMFPVAFEYEMAYSLFMPRSALQR